jgi:FSR family fosmidomycin resistance protein-like MFS transporter
VVVLRLLSALHHDLAMVQSFSVSLLKALHGVSFEAATMTLTAYMLCGALGMLVGGLCRSPHAQQRQGGGQCMAVAAVLLALCGTGCLVGMATMVVLAATGFAIGIGGPSRDMMIKKATPKGATGRVYGLVYSGLDVGFAISPGVVWRCIDGPGLVPRHTGWVRHWCCCSVSARLSG